MSTESFGQGAYGGAGMVLTRALAENVAATWKESEAIRMAHFAGDYMLSGAIAFTQGRPNRSPNIYYERSFHQNDLHGTAQSLFKAGFRWITFHHWAWLFIFPGMDEVAQMKRVYELFGLLDSENVFQNYLLKQDATETLILTNGYCITRYSPPLTELEMYRMEYLPEGKGNRFNIDGWGPTHGPYRPERFEGKDKITWFLSSIEPRHAMADVYTMQFEVPDAKITNRKFSVDWVVQ